MTRLLSAFPTLLVRPTANAFGALCAFGLCVACNAAIGGSNGGNGTGPGGSGATGSGGSANSTAALPALTRARREAPAIRR